MKSRILRALVCLLVICCLVINISPIKARAVDPLTLSAAAILGVTILGLSAYCGFVLAPPDVDYLEDVGEEFNEFLEVVIATGGMPDDDDDDTNNPVDDLIDQITSSTFDKVKVYTDAVGDALKGDDLIYDPAIAGGFAGCEAAFKLFLKWMIQNGYLDRSVDVPAASGWSYYGDYYLPTIPEIDGFPYVAIYLYARSTYQIIYSNEPLYYHKTWGALSHPGDPQTYYRIPLPLSDLEIWDSYSSYSVPADPSVNTSPSLSYTSGTPLWSNYDIVCTTTQPNYLFFAGSEPSNSAPEEEQIKPLVVLGPISGSIADGLTANGIPLPDQFNYVKLFDGFSDSGVSGVFDNINQIAQYLKDGTLTLDDYQDSLSYKEPETPDETQPSTPVDDPDVTTPSQVPIDGTLGGAPVGDFLSNLGNLIMSPFQWIWNKIQSFFDPWITSIGNWFSNVRADIQAIPSKFESWFSNIIDGIKTLPESFSQWFNDLIDGVKAIPQEILDGIDSRFPSTEDNREIDDFKLDLTGFFPFCLPYDIYEFLSILAADPVAPVFTWEIAVPQLGRTFEIEVDLSTWDDVAGLFRKLELLAFIVGLAYVTREKYIRG